MTAVLVTGRSEKVLVETVDILRQRGHIAAAESVTSKTT